MKLPLVFFFVLVFWKFSSSQEIYGEWIKIHAENIDKSIHTNPYNEFVNCYEKIKIFKDSVYFYKSPIDSPLLLKSNIDNNILDIGIRKYTFQLNEDTLFLFDEFNPVDINAQPLKFTFINIESLLSNNILKDSIIEITLDSLIITNSFGYKYEDDGYYISLDQFYRKGAKYHYLTPTFYGEYGINGEKGDFSKYIQDNIDYYFGFFNNAKSVYSKFSLTIDRSGNVIEVTIEEGNNKSFNKKLLKVLKSKGNVWKQNNDISYTKLIVPIKFIKKKLRNTLCYEYYKKGNRMHLKGKYNSAIRFYTKAILEDSTFVDAYYNRAAIYFELNQLNEACSDWEKIYRLGKNDSYDYINQFCSSPDFYP